MKLSDIIATASAWHGGQSSALYSFASTEKIHTREHKIELLAEIVHEIGSDGMEVDTLADEKQELGALFQFVQSAPVDTDLSLCVLDHNGGIVSLIPE